MHSLFPETEAYTSEQLDTGDGHILYVEQAGNPDGIPVIFLHGGPGSGCNPNHRRYFDPKKYRIVIFDQRGCNRSTPAGCVENNTTRHILADMERIRNKLSINQWLVFGGSWGATLALLYAESCPDQIMGLVLRGSFLARESDLAWFAQSGVNRIFPDYWDDFTGDIPVNEQADIIEAFHKRVHTSDHKMQKKFARKWSNWAGRVVTWNLQTNGQNSNHAGEENIEKIIHEVLIETHYAKNRYFIKQNQILEDIHKLPAVPVIIIHGRRDMTCTLESSWLLHQAIPGSDLVIVPDAGHLAGEAPMTNALVTATNRMAERFA